MLAGRLLVTAFFLPIVALALAQEGKRQAASADRPYRQPSFADTAPKRISLSEIVVKGRKPPVQFRLDRQVYRAAEFANAANGNAADLVKNLPSANVNAQGEITLRGSTSFQVLLNGRPTQGDPAFVLAQIPAGQIEQVEWISTPGAAFDADGRAGILNIVTKTAPENGLMAQASVMAGAPAIHRFDNERYTDPQRRSADISLAYRKAGWELNGGFNHLRNDNSGFRDGTVTTYLPGKTTSIPSKGERSYRRRTIGGRLSAAFEPNDRTRLEAGLYIGRRFQSRVADLLYSNTRADQASGSTSRFTYFNRNTQDKEGMFSLANLGYARRLGTKARMELSAQYEGARLESLTTNDNLSWPGLDRNFQETENPGTNPLHAYRLKADFSGRSGTMGWQAGYQFRHDDQDGAFTYRYRNLGDPGFSTDPDFTSTVRVANHIHAVYGQLNGERNRTSWQAGLRAEHTHRSLQTGAASALRELNMPNLFPSFLVRHRIEERTTLRLGFNRRIKRTNNFELNPIPEREHSETLEQGDPDLLPERIGTWELALERRFAKGSLSVSAYRQRVLDPIQRVNRVYNDTILSRIYTNAGRALQTGLESNLTLRIGKAWQSVIGGNLYHYAISGSLFGQEAVGNDGWVWSLNSTQTLSLQKRWMLQFSLNYLSRRVTVQGADDAFVSPNLSLRKTMGDERLSLQLQWLHMDAGLGVSNRQRISTWAPDFHNSTLYVYEPDQVQLSASFNLSRRNRRITLPQSEMAEKEF